MKPSRFQMSCHRALARGMALPIAIFIIAALAVLGVYMVTVSGVQQTVSSQAIAAARASLAARSGIEWAVHKAVAPTTQPGTCNVLTGFSPAGDGLTGASVAVTCSYSTLTVAGATYHTYYLASTASYGTAGTQDYAERKIEATVCRSTGPTATEC